VKRDGSTFSSWRPRIFLASTERRRLRSLKSLRVGSLSSRLRELSGSFNPKGYESVPAVDIAEMEAEVVVISDARELTKRAPAGFLVPCPCPEELSPVLYAIPLQLLAHDLSLLKRMDPDSPRGLSKVTETW